MVSGCGVFGSSDSSPDWTGDWQVTQGFDEEPPDVDLYTTYTEESLTVVREAEDGCRIFRYEIVNVDGNEITYQVGNDLQTERLEVSGSTLTVTILRSNFSRNEGNSSEAISVEDSPTELVGGGCQQSTIQNNQVYPLGNSRPE